MKGHQAKLVLEILLDEGEAPNEYELRTLIKDVEDATSGEVVAASFTVTTTKRLIP